MEERVRNYLSKVADHMDSNPNGKLHLSRNCNGIPIFEECNFDYVKEDLLIKKIEPEEMAFILCNGTIICNNNESAKKLAAEVIMNNTKYFQYFRMRYENKSPYKYGLEFLIRYASAIYLDGKENKAYISKYAGAFTSYESALWRYAVKYSDVFKEYQVIEVDNKAEALDEHITF